MGWLRCNIGGGNTKDYIGTLKAGLTDDNTIKHYVYFASATANDNSTANARCATYGSNCSVTTLYTGYNSANEGICNCIKVFLLTRTANGSVSVWGGGPFKAGSSIFAIVEEE